MVDHNRLYYHALICFSIYICIYLPCMCLLSVVDDDGAPTSARTAPPFRYGLFSLSNREKIFFVFLPPLSCRLPWELRINRMETRFLFNFRNSVFFLYFSIDPTRNSETYKKRRNGYKKKGEAVQYNNLYTLSWNVHEQMIFFFCFFLKTQKHTHTN